MNFKTMETMNFAKTIKLGFSVNERFPTYTVRSSADIYKTILPAFSDYIDVCECVYALYFNQANGLLGIFKVSQGGISSSVVDLRLVLSGALNCLATGIILVHNHPSGNLKPSEEDRRITKQLSEAGNLLNIRLLDHLIITKTAYLSFADEGMI